MPKYLVVNVTDADIDAANAAHTVGHVAYTCPIAQSILRQGYKRVSVCGFGRCTVDGETFKLSPRAEEFVRRYDRLQLAEPMNFRFRREDDTHKANR